MARGAEERWRLFARSEMRHGKEELEEEKNMSQRQHSPEHDPGPLSKQKKISATNKDRRSRDQILKLTSSK